MRKILTGGVARFLSSVGNLILPLFIAKYYSAESLGYFTLYLSVVIFLSYFCRLGMERAIVRLCSNSRMNKLGSGRYVVRVFLCSCFVTIAVFISFDSQIIEFISDGFLAELLLYGMWAVFPFSAIYLISAYLKGVNKPIASLFADPGLVGLAVSSFLIISDRFGVLPTLADLVLVYNVLNWLLLGFYLVFCFNKKTIRSKVFSRGGFKGRGVFIRSSCVFMAIGLTQYIQQVCMTFFVGHVVDANEVGIVRFAERISLLVPFPLLVINAIYSARFSFFFSKKEKNKLKSDYKSSVLASVFLGGSIVGCILFGWNFVLAIFGMEYSDAWNYLLPLLVAQFVNVLTGPSDTLLGMTGNERTLLLISIVSAVLILPVFYFFAVYYSLLWAIYAMAVVMVLRNLIQAYFARLVMYKMA